MFSLKSTRTLISLLLGALFIADAAGWSPLPVLPRLENIVYDYRLLLTMPGGVDERIVIVDIDDRSLHAEGHWPWGRDKLAQLVDTLFDHYYVSLLGFDVVFAEYDNRSGLQTLNALAEGPLSHIPEYIETLERLRPTLDRDHLFAESLKDRDVLLGFSSSMDNRFGELPPPVLMIDEALATIPFHSVSGYNANLPELQQASWGGGFFDNSSVDQDGVFRRMPLVQRIDDALYESLPMAIARSVYGQPPLQLQINPTRTAEGEEWGLEAITAGDLRIPVDHRGVALIPYRGEAGGFRYVSATDILHHKVPVEVLDGVIAIVGTTAPGLLDLRATPVQNKFPGVEVQANLIAGMIDGKLKRQPAYTMAIEILLLVVVLLFGIFLLPLFAPFWGGLATLAALGLLVLLNVELWQHANLALPLASQGLLLIALFLFNNLWGFFIESRSKRRLGFLFGQYVPTEVVEEMSAKGGDFGLEGESREMTVFFSDIRSFTTISEGMESDELKRMINAYLTPMTALIHQYRGTVDKYIGDAVMAFWGAPLPDPEHPRLGVLTALAMQREMEQVRTDFAARGWPQIRIGIGINSGKMNVGNMGSEFRMSYTVLGDAVNLGARLEGLTKEYGVETLISEYTREEIPDIACRELDRVRVKGKEQPVGVYEPIGILDELPESRLQELERYHQALEAYRHQQWDEAEAQFNAMVSDYGERKMFELYLERIAYLRQNPPGEGWDAVFTFTTK